jgi:hypothetical protein
MLLEELLSLPVGTRVFGEVELPTTLPGVVASLQDGSHFIRWDDGYSTIPLGQVREYDEYIAGHTELRPTRSLHLVHKANSVTKGQEGVAPLEEASRVRRA